MDTLKINTVEPLTSRGQGYVQMEMDCGPAIYRGQIKVRGNSTAMGYKKPYAVKLETKAHLLGSGDKKYILLANCFDPTMMRNFLALSMAKELNIPYTPTCKYARALTVLALLSLLVAYRKDILRRMRLLRR